MDTFSTKSPGRIWPWKPSVLQPGVNPAVQPFPLVWQVRFLAHRGEAHQENWTLVTAQSEAPSESWTPLFSGPLCSLDAEKEM